MSGIRVGYSGLISFFVGLVSIFTTLIFTVLVTRTLTTSEFGTWGLINGLIVYPMILDPVISYWVLRESARGLPSGKTAILSTGIFSTMGISIYVVVTYFVGQNTDVNQTELFFGLILIPVMFLNAILSSIGLGWKPQIVSYSILALGISKIIFGIIFVYFLKMGVLGIILAVTISFMISIIILAILSREKIKNEIDWKFLKKWFRLSWIPLYPGISSIILRLDIIIFTVITGSVLGIAFWSAAVAITVIVAQAGNISIAVYPKLMQDKNRDYLKNNITKLFYFAIPITALTIIFAESGLYILNPKYVAVSLVVILLSIQLFLNTLSKIFENLLLGMDVVDVNEKSTFKDYVKSKLFFTPTIRAVQMSVYVGLLFIGLLTLASMSYSEIDLLIFWALVWMLTEIPITIYFYKCVKQRIDLKLETRIISKYFIIAIIVFGITYFIADKFLIYDSNLFEFIPGLLLFVTLGVGSYLTITYLLDKRTRELSKMIINEIHLMLKR